MDFYEALKSTNPNIKLLPWSTKDKRKLDNTNKALLQLQDPTPFFQGANPIESGRLYLNIRIATTSPEKVLLDMSPWTETYDARLHLANI